MKLRILPVLILLACRLHAGEPDAKTAAAAVPARTPDRIVAAQINSLDFKDRAALTDFFRGLKKAGVNTVVVRVFQNPGDGFHRLCAAQASTGYYFRTEAAPVVCDLLGPLVEDAHSSGLKIFAWMNTRYADYGIEERSDLHSLCYDFDSASLKPGRGLSVFHPEVQARLAGLYRELARYPIDGVLVQDDLMLRHNEDFSAAAVAGYRRETGRDPSPALFYRKAKTGGRAAVTACTDAFREWSGWKAGKLLALADLLRRTIKSENPKIRFGCNYYYETALKPEKGLEWFGQDLKRAAERKHDFYALMLYHRQIREELGLSEAELDTGMAKAGEYFVSTVASGGEPVLKLMTRDFKSSSPIPEPELEQVVKSIKGRQEYGLAFFPVWSGMEAELSGLIAGWGNND